MNSLVPRHDRPIPSMGGDALGPRLHHYAMLVPPEQAIVEVGVWFGAGSRWLAHAAATTGAPLHLYDRWILQPREAERAREYGIKLLPGADLLPYVKANLDGIGADIHYHKGHLRDATWHGQPIALYVDDCTKAKWEEFALRIFASSWVAGAVLVLMDYHHDKLEGRRYAAQKRWAAANADKLEVLEDNHSAAIFRYRGH